MVSVYRLMEFRTVRLKVADISSFFPNRQASFFYQNLLWVENELIPTAYDLLNL